MISRQTGEQNPAPAQPHPPQRRRREPQNPWVMPWILQRVQRGCYRTLLDKQITTDIPSYRKFIKIPPVFFDLIKERNYNHLKKSHRNFRKPLEVGLKLIVTLSHLFTGENYSLLQYQWRVRRTTIHKFVSKVCKAGRFSTRTFHLSSRRTGLESH